MVGTLTTEQYGFAVKLVMRKRTQLCCVLSSTTTIKVWLFLQASLMSFGISLPDLYSSKKEAILKLTAWTQPESVLVIDQLQIGICCCPSMSSFPVSFNTFATSDTTLKGFNVQTQFHTTEFFCSPSKDTSTT